MIISKALKEPKIGDHVVSVYINKERHFAFVELKNIELATACMQLDGELHVMHGDLLNMDWRGVRQTCLEIDNMELSNTLRNTSRIEWVFEKTTNPLYAAILAFRSV